MALDAIVTAQAYSVAQTRTATLAQTILTALQTIQPTLLADVSDSQATTLPFLTLASIQSWLLPYVQTMYTTGFQAQATTLLQGANLAASTAAPATGP